MFLTLLLFILGTQTSIAQKPASESTDVVLLIDSSNALGRRAFPSVKSFVNRIISSLPIGPNKYRVALVQYSDDVHIEFQLDDHKAKNPMLNHLKKSFLFRGGPLRTGNALQKVHETFFKIPRKDRNQIVVVTTSGESDDDVEEPAKRLHGDGIKIIALGTQVAPLQEVQSVATHPFYYHFDTPKELLMFSQNMSEVIGAAIQMDSRTDLTTPAPPSVKDRVRNKTAEAAVCLGDSIADIVFVVDEGVSRANSEYIRTFLQDTVNSLDVNEACVRIGLVTYSTEPKVLTFLGDETEKNDLLRKIQSFSAKEGKANLGAAINITTKSVFSRSRKTQGAEQVATIITHRPSDDDIRGAATLISRAGVTVFAIGIERADANQLTQIVSHPPVQNIMKLTRFSDLPSLATIFQKKLFNEIEYKLYVQSERRAQLKSGCVETEKADIYFLIDDSSSIHETEFNKMKIFLKEFIKLFTLGPDHVRFGVVKYSNFPKLQIELGCHTTHINLEKDINNIKQTAGDETRTGDALKFMQPLFEEARKQRDGKVPCYLIVLTDGEALDSVKVPAEMLRNAKINVYAIGVKDANRKELLEITGSESRVYFVQQFDFLEKIKNNVVRDLCNEKACKEMKADVMFLVDSSGSISPDDFAKMQIFMMELVNKSDIGRDQMCVGAVQFSGTTEESFPLNKYSTKSSIIEAIGSMSLIGTTTLTGAALQFVSDYFEPAKGGRSAVNKVLILITDGEAQDEVKTPATALRDKGITIYSVGVFNANKTQLEEISGKPEKVFYVENFDILKQIQNDIMFGICNPDEKCKRIEHLDIVFVIDSSGSIGLENYGLMKDFMIGIVNKSDVGRDHVQYGALKYSDDPQTLFYLNEHNTKSKVIEAIQGDQHLGGNTYTAEALEHSELLFTKNHGSRKRRGVPQILMVITDGESHDRERLDEVSKSIRASGVIIIAIGIKEANPDELLTMAGSKENQYYVDTFDGLKYISKMLSDHLCNTSNPGCVIQADLVFLIDGSRSIPKADFNKMKDFLKKLLDLIDYNDKIQVGMAQFSDMYQEEFSLGAYQNKSELKDKIVNVLMMEGGNTFIGKALKEVKAFFNSTRRRIPRNILSKLLVITDGDSDDSVEQPAEDLRNEGVEIHVIGVGKIKQGQLYQITDSSDRIYTVANFSELSNIVKPVTDEMCKDDVTATCFVDVVMGFDISSQKPGDLLFNHQRLLEAYLPSILKDFTSYSTVHCNKGTKTQFSVASAIENTDPPLLPALHVDHEKILEKLRKVVISSPSYLNVKFLDNLWNAFENISSNQNRSKVLLLFSDGLDDDKEALKRKSEEFRKKGLDGILTVALEGATNFADLLSIEFGKGFGYNNQLTIGTQNIARRLFAYVEQIAERTCCCSFCTCMAEEGPRGQKGKMGPQGSKGLRGHPGYIGEDGEPGHRGIPGPEGHQGHRGDRGNRGVKGLQGPRGEKGENGIAGVDGIPGEEGSLGLSGLKGETGEPGLPGSTGPRGLPGDHGPKGFQGDPGNSGVDNDLEGGKGPKGMRGSAGERGSIGLTGVAGSPGNRGPEGRRGVPGPQSPPSFPPSFLVFSTVFEYAATGEARAPPLLKSPTLGQKGTPGPNGLQGEQGFQGPQGTIGIPGETGEKGHSGNKGLQGPLGIPGPKGNIGKPGLRGNKGEPGDPGVKGARGSRGPQGIRGDEGTAGYGGQGIKGSKGEEGFLGYTGIQGEPGDIGIPGEPGPKGIRGRMGTPGLKGGRGDPGAWGPPGHLGAKGANGLASFSPCELIEYVREHSPCWAGTAECPLYPTELVFALDVSQDTTPQIFEQMREIVIAIVNNTKIRESNCPVGARVAIVSYSSNTHYLIRFSDFHSKNHLLQELNALSYQRSTNRRDTGASMRFVARNVFKRTLPSANVRKVAVFFSNGQSDNSDAINTAVLEFSALDIHPAVIAFKNIPSINRAFAMDDTRLFQVINIRPERDYIPALQRLQLCVLCYDKCRPENSCLRAESSLPRAYVDAAFILENSRKISPVEFKKLKDFLSTAIDNFNISAAPETSLIGDRVAVVSHAPLEFRHQIQESPVRTEFDFVTYSSKRRMKRHIQESVQQLNGAVAVGHAMQWTINNIFSEAPNQRKYKAIFVVSVGKTSQWDKKVLTDVTLRAKCQGYVLFVLSLGNEYDDTELEELASMPLEHHMVQLGRIHKAELGYAAKFLKPFLRLLKSEINSYPQTQLRRKCAIINTQRPVYIPQRATTFAADNTVSSEAMALDAEPAFLRDTSYDSVSPQNAISSGQQIIVLGN
ncbi:collagen alpha-6(VI) chain-like isoform X2 [Rhineura floridana]|nr:collagen alpha-6(VI) chain-like isoform X2 [Rhineura floridana]